MRTLCNYLRFLKWQSGRLTRITWLLARPHAPELGYHWPNWYLPHFDWPNCGQGTGCHPCIQIARQITLREHQAMNYNKPSLEKILRCYKSTSPPKETGKQLGDILNWCKI
jgi:hypothetical protein